MDGRRGFGLGGHGRIDHEALAVRFRRHSIGSGGGGGGMKRPHSTYTDDQCRMTPPERRRRRIAAACLLAGTALVASSWTAPLPAAGGGYEGGDRRLAESSSSFSFSTGPTVDADGVKHFTPHGPFLGRFDRSDARRLELEASAKTDGDVNIFQQYFGNNDPHRSHRRTSAKDSEGDADTSERTLTSQHTAPKRIAVVRPFSPHSAGEILKSFDTWDTYWPCTSNPLHPFDTDSEPGESTSGDYPYDYVVDLYLSFSQTYADVSPSDLSVGVRDDLKLKFNNNGGWNGCFDKLYNIGK